MFIRRKNDGKVVRKNRFFLYLAGGILLLIIGAGGVFLCIGKFADKDGTAINGTTKNSIIGNSATEKVNNVILYANGYEITNENMKILNGYAEIPLTEVLKSFGATVEWLDNNNADITLDGRKYRLNLSEPSLVDKEQIGDFNLLWSPPGWREAALGIGLSAQSYGRRYWSDGWQ